ncbi:hypothetical protein Pa4123_40840 [Phytohabitans aurantiacus]|uniref:Uncharacterized protein n=1 Tax=Phytohabitans aurantiacus TaxID=3016789 RepID=A0ABQ5QX86_9ACTN|nr:hypothetical protein Pa4123_40840 [Phytohabitans aurantiacus]
MRVPNRPIRIELLEVQVITGLFSREEYGRVVGILDSLSLVDVPAGHSCSGVVVGLAVVRSLDAPRPLVLTAGDTVEGANAERRRPICIPPDPETTPPTIRRTR